MVMIKNLKITCLRGITELPLDLEGKSLLVRGENGTGKSSIVDAIEFFFTGMISHLEGNQSLSTQRHCPHVKSKPEDTAVEITFNPNTIKLIRKFDSIYTIPPEFEEYFKITQQGTFILRRAQILEFIISKPAERFRAIGNIIGIDNLDNIELEMMRLKENFSGKITSKKAVIRTITEELSEILGKNILNYEEAIPLINEILGKYDLEPVETLCQLSSKIEDMLKQTKKVSLLEKSNSLSDILNISKQILLSKDIVNKIKEYCDKINQLVQENEKEQLTHLDLLNSGKMIIDANKTKICPLCEQEINSEKLIESINQRLLTLKSLSENASKIRILGTENVEMLKDVMIKVKSILQKIEKIPELENEKKSLQNNLTTINNIIFSLETGKELKNIINVNDIDEQLVQFQKDIQRYMDESNKILEKIGLSKKEKEFLEDISIIEQVKSKIAEISKVTKEINKLENYFKISEKIYICFSQCKKEKMQQIFNSIENDIGDFYSKIHPNEPHKNIKLLLTLGRRASAEIKIDSFERKREDPRGFSSEGHLDTLGVCIFFAFVKNFNQKCPLVILDDIVSTVDAQHRTKISKILFENFRDKQLIITTHDGLWYEQLRYAQITYGVSGNFVNLKIVDWCLDDGPKIKPYKPRWDVILDKIANDDKSGAGNEGRQYLEWVLETICSITQAPVAFKSSGKYEVSDLLEPAKNRLINLINNQKITKEFAELFKELESTIILGNILSHNNPLSEHVSKSEITKFCNDVHNIHIKILCPKCNHLVNYFRDLKILRCSNPKCKQPYEIKTK